MQCNCIIINDEKIKKYLFTIFQNEDTTQLMVDGYSASGFTLNNKMKVFGPMVLFPNAVLSWRVQVCIFKIMSSVMSIRFHFKLYLAIFLSTQNALDSIAKLELF